MPFRLLAYPLITALASLAAAALAQPVAWTQQAVSGPSPRYEHAMAYDAARGVTVLFGGATSDIGVRSGETWEWNGAAWTRRVASGPSARSLHAMAYDSARGVSVLFGGWTGSYDSQTWEWNGSAWTQRMVSGPVGLLGHTMAYDSARGVTILFGGDYGIGLGIYSRATWEWNGTGGGTWTPRMVSGPSGRLSHAMAYDSARGVTVLFGGYTGQVGSGPTCSGETWEWDGTAWSLRAGSGPSPRFGHAMAYDAARGVTVLFGGTDSTAGPYLNDTWEWNGTYWTQLEVSGPAGRYDVAAAYDAARRAVVLFGGYGNAGPFGDTWLLASHCGSADFNHDGDTGTDQDIDAFFACLSGNCCPACDSADFNGDGDTGTDADIESFFRVLGGGSC